MPQLNLWNTAAIKQHNKETDQSVFKDEQLLVSFSQDFGKLIYSPPAAVSIPQTTNSLQHLISFAYDNQLPLTIRGKGLSQGGQSLARPGSLMVSMECFDSILEWDRDGIWVEANASWSDVLKMSLKKNQAPKVLPYNCNLSVAGVLSAGGVGASSFKYGAVNAHVNALEVIDGTGRIQIVDKKSSLFQACLSGQGRFGVITKACIALKPVFSKIKTFFLVYTDQNQWLEDIDKIQEKADYLELFCSPSVQGAKLQGERRIPMVQWLYGLHCSFEYESQETDLIGMKPWRVLGTQEEGILSYYLRHDSRFAMMKKLGQWELAHPWYECFISGSVLKEYLAEVLDVLPLHYANLVHIVPIARHSDGFLMLPEGDAVYSLMILNPGIVDQFKESCLETIQRLDEYFLPRGGKRYLSGFLGKELSPHYWKEHFGDRYPLWEQLKNQYDPRGILGSVLHQG